MLRRSAVLLALTLLPCAAFGQTYVGVELGRAESDQAIAFDLPPDTNSNDSSDEVLKYFVGYRFSPGLAFEIGYADLGDSYTTFNVLGANETTRMTVEAIYASLIGSVDVAANVDLFARLGLADWDVELDASIPGQNSIGSGSDLDLLVGLGFEWAYGDRICFRFEWEQFQNVGSGVQADRPPTFTSLMELNGQDINVLGFAVVYKFGDVG